MNRFQFLSLIILGALAIGALCLLFPASNGEHIDQSTIIEARSEKSKRMGIQGYPDKFGEMHRQIRERADGVEYPVNYQINELNKARAARKSPGTQLPWVQRGPGNVGGRTRAILVDAGDTSNNTWFAGSVAGGVWKTTDAGLNWRPVTDNMPNLAISSLAQSPANPDVIYAGTGEGFGNLDGVRGAGIFKSMDGGETWEQLESTITTDFFFVNRLIVDPDDEQLVLAATNTGIFRSVNGGTSWLEVYEDQGRVQDIRYMPGNFSTQFAADNACCILRSTDAGETWEINYDAFFSGVARIELATSTANPSWVYAATQLTSADRGGDIYFTQDGGDTWTLAQDEDNTPTNWFDPGTGGNQGWYDNTIAVHPFAPDSLLIGGVQLWRTHLRGSDTVEGSAATAFNKINTEYMDFVSFSGGSNFGGQVDIGTVSDQLVNVTEDDMTSVEIRFGPGLSQMAHRFTVSPTGGTNSDGGAGIPYIQYEYKDYVEVPFEVWDIDNNIQLMASFRDQSDDGAYNLINFNSAGPRDTQSREYIFVHHEPYNANERDAEIGVFGGAGQKAIYFMWPFLADNNTWDPNNLPNSQLQIIYSTFTARVRQQQQASQAVIGGGLVHVDQHNITMIPVDAATNTYSILNGNDGGVYFSENGGQTWNARSDGYVTAQFYDADKRPNFDVYLAGAQDNGTVNSPINPTIESDWSTALGGDGMELFWHSTNGDRAIISFQNNFFFTTNNGGQTWSRSTTGLGDLGDNGIFISPLGWSKTRPDVLFTIGSSGIWRSDNFATNWTLAQSIPADELGTNFSSLCKVRVSIADPEIVWGGCFMSPLGNQLTMHLSRDGGNTFDPVPNTDALPAINGPARISGFATHPTNSNTAYALFSRSGLPKILRTTNTGFTWEDISGFADSQDGTSTNGFPDVAVFDLLVLPNTPTELWAATEIGIFRSTDSGETWAYADNGMPAVSTWRLRLVDGQILAVTHGRGLWTVQEPIEVSNESEGLPVTFDLAQNYPNPFNPNTTIEFALPAPTDVELKVFDISGREVATLASGLYQAGRHQVDWDAKEFASGVYMYRMQAGDYIATQQMTLVK